jgi:hypothetical protein
VGDPKSAKMLKEAFKKTAFQQVTVPTFLGKEIRWL